MLNTIADGLRSMPRRLALVMASIALNWLYDCAMNWECAANVGVSG